MPDAGTLVRTITVAGAGAHIWDVDVLLAVTHTHPIDLDITLTSPSGTVVTLTTDNGSSFDNVFNGTRFDDQATVPVTDATFANNVVLAAAAPEQPLARLCGENPNGIWTLRVTDDSGTNIGTFHGVSLVIATVPELPNEVRRRVSLAPGTPIPDNNTVTSTQIVRGGGAFVTRVRLRTNITHTFAADLDITLTSPGGGTSVTVTTDNAGGSDNVFNGTWWDDLTGSSVTDFVYTNNVTATPLAPEEALASFIGGPANGTWTLNVTDDSGGDTGTLASWELEVFTGSCAHTPAAPPGFAPPVTTTFANTTSVAVPLTGTTGTTTSTINVTGAGPYLWDLNAVTNLQHTFSSDLVVTLTSPTGTAVVLTSRNGGLEDNVFDGTRWDDQADLPATDALYVNLQPRPALVPEGALGAFIGEDPNGTWTLTIEDVGPGDSGTLNGWSLQVHTISAPPAPVTVTLLQDSPLGIPDGTQAGLVRTGTIAGAGSFLTRAQLRTSILHPSPAQLEIFLTSPAGTTVTISTANGGANANVFNGTTWEDRPGSLPATDAPYAADVVRPTLVPEEAMSAFIGENPNGTWTLTVLDTTTGQSGTLSSWALVLETGAAWNLTQSLYAPGLCPPCTPAGVGVGGIVTVTIEYLLPSGAPILRTYTVAGNSRQTVWVNQEPQLSSTDVSATITSDLPIIVERAMYLNRGGQTFAAGHGSAGVTAPNTSWFLAEGATGPYFDLFVLIANPTQSTANITARFLRTDGTVVTRTYSVEPKSRFNIWVDQEGPELADTAVSTIIQSDVPVLVERSMWWPGDGTTWHEAHNSFGTTEPGFVWAMAEGEQGGPSSVETYVLVANVSNFAGLVKVTLYKEDGSSLVKTLTVNPNSRLNVPVGAAEVDGGFGPANVNGRRFGIVVESLVPAGGAVPAKIVVERAMYSNAGGVVWAAGTNALATKLQ